VTKTTKKTTKKRKEIDQCRESLAISQSSRLTTSVVSANATEGTTQKEIHMSYIHSALAIRALVPVPTVDFRLAFGGLVFVSVPTKTRPGRRRLVRPLVVLVLAGIVAFLLPLMSIC
jgi:hypothetical protein